MKKLLLICSCALFFVGGCANSPNKQLLGTWLQPIPNSPTETRGFEFKKHGKVITIRSNQQKYTLWRISENNILVLSGKDLSAGSMVMTTDYYTITTLNDSMLVLTAFDGTISYYSRSK